MQYCQCLRPLVISTTQTKNQMWSITPQWIGSGCLAVSLTCYMFITFYLEGRENTTDPYRAPSQKLCVSASPPSPLTSPPPPPPLGITKYSDFHHKAAQRAHIHLTAISSHFNWTQINYWVEFPTLFVICFIQCQSDVGPPFGPNNFWMAFHHISQIVMVLRGWFLLTLQSPAPWL